MGEEELYTMLRQYGTMVDLVCENDTVFKVTFKYTAGAVAARNCLHRIPVGAKGNDDEKVSHLLIEFEPFMQKWLKDAIVNNSRYSIPLILALTVTLTYFVWDPIR